MSAAPNIHPSAIVDARAELDPSVRVGPYAIVDADVRIGAGTTIGAHCTIGAGTTIGRDNVFHPYGAIGGAPQDKKYAGEPTTLVIGDGNTFREFVTVNRGTSQDRGRTDIGDDNWIMAYVHIAHDCVVGSHTIFANTTNLAGHVEIGDWVILGGYTGVHQFCKVGAHAMTGVGTVVLHDIPPFVMVSGNSAQPHGLNSEGLRRRGFDAARIQALRRAYKSLYKRGLSLDQARAELAQQQAQAEGESAADLSMLLEFLGRVTRGIVR
jgi:UDP-N-acetylglucosamine acyltransferase